jgi:hypothetical protein
MLCGVIGSDKHATRADGERCEPPAELVEPKHLKDDGQVLGPDRWDRPEVGVVLHERLRARDDPGYAAGLNIVSIAIADRGGKAQQIVNTGAARGFGPRPVPCAAAAPRGRIRSRRGEARIRPRSTSWQLSAAPIHPAQDVEYRCSSREG